jgi:hypothetical protein
LIYSFIEQQSLYAETVNDGGITVSGTGFDRSFRKDWWDALGPEGKKAFGSVPIYKCPSRRGGVQFNDGVNLPGPLKDYTATALVRGGTISQWWHGQNIDSAHFNIGPFRHAIITTSTTGTVTSWTPRDTFAWWSDGISNEVIFAENHTPVDHLGLCKEHNSGTNITRAQMGDCSYLSSRPEFQSGNYEWRPWTVMRSTIDVIPTSGTVGNGYPIATLPNAYSAATDNSWNSYSFGSYHPGVFNVAIGDGAVMTISNVISRPNLTRMIWVDDCVVLEFPD